MAKTKKASKQTKKTMDSEILTYIYALLCITLSIIGLLNIGVVGTFLTSIIRYFFGELYGVVYAALIVCGMMLLLQKNFTQVKARTFFGLFCFFCSWLIMSAVPGDKTLTGMVVFNEYIKNSSEIFNQHVPSGIGSGGIIGALLYSLSTLLFDYVGTWIFIVALWILGLLMFVSNARFRGYAKSIKTTMGSLKKKLFKARVKTEKPIKKKKEKVSVLDNQDEFDMDVMDYNQNQSKFDFLTVEDEADSYEPIIKVEPEISIPQVKTETEVSVEPIVAASEEFNSIFEEDYSKYKLPKITLLVDNGKNTKSIANMKAAKESGDRLMQFLDEFGVKATLVETHVGPSVTKFEVKPDLGVRVSKISNLQHDIKLALAAKDIRIEAPIPSKSAVGIEIPNVEKTTVLMREVLKAVPAKYDDSKLLFVLGKDLMGNCIFGELNKMPHLLIAGATGSGKSVCVNSIIVSILMRAKPDEVKLLLIDPKKVEFTMYENVPHLLGPVITSGEEASSALKVIVTNMDNRYELFSRAGVRNITGYNQYLENHPEEGLKKMPWIVVIIDELADLMLVAAKDVESSIQRITQLARAAGIHLIVATQRPSVDVITGIIKANIPSRIAFAVSSAIDSRTILDQQGAEKLLGMGDMLYIPVGEQVVTRVQGVYVSDEEVKKVCDFVSAQGRPKFDDAFIRLQLVDTGSGAFESFNDPLYDEVREFVIQSQKASTSFIQRKFSIGYSRAARLIDVLEEHGVVGPARGSKPREVFMKSERKEENE